MTERAERSMNIGDNSLPKKLNLVSPDRSKPRKPNENGVSYRFSLRAAKRKRKETEGTQVRMAKLAAVRRSF
jgi:hypothetical protein